MGLPKRRAIRAHLSSASEAPASITIMTSQSPATIRSRAGSHQRRDAVPHGSPESRQLLALSVNVFADRNRRTVRAAADRVGRSRTMRQEHTEHPEQWPADDFVPTEELARRQGVKPITSVDDLAAEVDPFESDEEYEAFLADLYASRRAGLA